MDFLVVGDGFDHEIWAVADVGVRTEENCASADGEDGGGMLLQQCWHIAAKPVAPTRALKKLRYVGALSSTLDNAPLPKKKQPGVGEPRLPALDASQSRAGIIVAKIPMKRIATSLMG